jgi:hypothetical protein
MNSIASACPSSTACWLTRNVQGFALHIPGKNSGNMFFPIRLFFSQNPFTESTFQTFVEDLKVERQSCRSWNLIFEFFRSSIIGLIKFITSNESSLVKKMNIFSVALQV